MIVHGTMELGHVLQLVRQGVVDDSWFDDDCGLCWVRGLYVGSCVSGGLLGMELQLPSSICAHSMDPAPDRRTQPTYAARTRERSSSSLGPALRCGFHGMRWYQAGVWAVARRGQAGGELGDIKLSSENTHSRVYSRSHPWTCSLSITNARKVKVGCKRATDGGRLELGRFRHVCNLNSVGLAAVLARWGGLSVPQPAPE